MKTTANEKTNAHKTIEHLERAGLAALVRAGEAKDWFEGHRGASMIAGARLLAEPGLPGPAAFALGHRLQGLLARDRDWFGPLGESDPSPDGVDPLLEHVRSGAAVLRGTGHSTIYGATALDVLARHPALATRRAVAGLVALDEAGRLDDPRRYFGTPDYFEAIDRDVDAGDAAPGSSAEAFRRAIASLAHLVADREIDGRHYYLTGEKIHLVTHAHAIATFERLGYFDVARRALAAQHALERLVAPSDALEPTRIEPIATNPFDAAFWEQPVPDLAHVIKLAEAFVAGAARVAEDERRSMARVMAAVWPMLGVR